MEVLSRQAFAAAHGLRAFVPVRPIRRSCAFHHLQTSFVARVVARWADHKVPLRVLVQHHSEEPRSLGV